MQRIEYSVPRLALMMAGGLVMTMLSAWAWWRTGGIMVFVGILLFGGAAGLAATPSAADVHRFASTANRSKLIRSGDRLRSRGAKFRTFASSIERFASISSRSIALPIW